MAFKDFFKRKPKYKDSDSMVRYKEIIKLGIEGMHQDLLGELAKTDESSSNRATAISYLKNQGLLADIAKNDNDSWVCMEALSKVTDRNLLTDVAKNAKHASVRYAALKKSRHS